MSILYKDGLSRLWSHIILKLNDKVDKIEGKGLSTNDYTAEDKAKLAGIETGATKTVVDSALSTESNNPVANSKITTKIIELQDSINQIITVDLTGASTVSED